MLRVDASNLPPPRAMPRPRRLLPNPPGTTRRGASSARHEMLPPPDEPTQVRRAPSPSRASFVDNELWTVKLELGDEDIARLYGQGMARGAVVWRKGMVEWRPLLITPEFKTLLRRTRLTPPPVPPAPEPAPALSAPPDALTLPRPARLPESMMPPEFIERLPISTLAPTSADFEPPAPRARRPLELAAVAVGAFALAWIGHATLSDGSSGNANLSAAAAAPAPAAAPAACEPTTLAAEAPHTEKSGIRTVSLADLPVAAGRGGGSAAAHAAIPSAPSHASVSRAVRSAPAAAPVAHEPAPAAVAAPPPEAPSRSDLVAAMSQVARASSSCGERGGSVRVVVTFANSGVARSIQVSGEDLPASTRSCIIGAASRARVSAFTGEPVTVSKAL